MRRPLTFPCAGEVLVGTLDAAAGATGLLVVSGGNEVRAGAHRGMARLAARFAAEGVPVFRYDRRGTGDSGGTNAGYAGSADDLSAAAAAFRAVAPGVRRMVGYGNCDAATALALFGRAAGLDALVLANPWVVESAAGDLPPAAAIRARYAERLRRPHEWSRLLRGGVDMRKLLSGLRALATRRGEAGLPASFADGIAGMPTTIVLAAGDATALAYRHATRGLPVPTPVVVPTASHSFARPGDAAVLEAAIRAAIAESARASAG